jgi:hypothetical protein
VTLLTLAPGLSLVKTDYETDCLSLPKGQLSSWPSFMPWTLQTSGLIIFLSQLQAWLMSQFIEHADAAHVLLEEDYADTRELVPLFSRVSPNPREQSAHLN